MSTMLKGSKNLLLCAAMTALTAFGCATDDAGIEGDEESAEGSEDLAALVAPIDQQSNRPNPNVPYIVDVKANGTGCRPGTWQTSVSPDGETFTTTFSEYVAEINNRQTLAVKDCLLSVTLKSPSGISYAVTDFFYSGYVLLDKGVTGFQSANYYFQGAPAAANKEKRTDLTGPVERSYLFQDRVTTADAVWSPCGKDRLLQVPTRLQVRRTGGGNGVGYINLAAVDGKTTGKVVFKLAWRKC